MNRHGHDFEHEFVSESVSEADSDTDTRFFGTSDSDSDTETRFLRTSDTDSDKVMTSDTGMSENLGHGLGHGHTSNTRVRSSLSWGSIFTQLIKVGQKIRKESP